MMVRSILHRLIAITLVLTIMAGAFSSVMARPAMASASLPAPAAATSGHVCPLTASSAGMTESRGALPAGAKAAFFSTDAKSGDIAMRARCYGCNLEPEANAGNLARHYTMVAYACADTGIHARNLLSLLKPPRS